MRYKVISTPNAKQPSVTENGGVLYVRVSAPPKEGVANQRLIKLLAEYFGIHERFIKIVSGHTARHKIVEIITK